MHADLWAKYGAKLPSDDALRWELEQERHFTRTGAAEFIPQYRATLAYAQLTGPDTLPPQEQHEEAQHGDESKPPAPLHSDRNTRRRNSGQGVVTYAVPLGPGSDIVVEFPFPPSEDDWDYFLGMLNAVKPRLVAQPERPAKDHTED